MSDAGGQFRIVTEAKLVSKGGVLLPMELDLGEIQSINDSYATSLISSGIPTQPCENALAIDYGTIEQITIEFARVMPRDVDDRYEVDSLHWSNGFWLYNLLKYVVNRWQVTTDGVLTYYIPDMKDQYNGWGYEVDDVGAVIKRGLNCYVTEFSPKYNPGVRNVISGNITFIVGGLRSTNTMRAVITYHYGDMAIVQSSNTGTFAIKNCPSTWGMANFDHWSTSESGTGTVYYPSDAIDLDSPLDLYARTQ